MGTEKTTNTSWRFLDEAGAFEWKNPHSVNQLYFPLCNEAGMMASVNTELHGDATTGQDTFLRRPCVIEDLHNTRSARNFWIYSEKLGAYSLTGNSAAQRSRLFTAEDTADVTIRGEFLAHTLTREDKTAGIRSEITIFCPVTDDKAEIMLVSVTNISGGAICFTPTTDMPLYARSAHSLRDHNHWTSLSHRMELMDWGVLVTPAMHHDESGHRPNRSTYFVLAAEGDGAKPVGQFPTVAEFIGEGGAFDWPQAVVRNLPPYAVPPNRRDGMEAVGALRFAQKELAPGQTAQYVVIEGVTEDRGTVLRCVERYCTAEKTQKALEENRSYWQERVGRIAFHTSDGRFDTWMRWVALQPMLRKIYGNSFLPHFDYGKGGRGWRDLWQDCLALLLQSPDETREVLRASFNGVRLDGSNATVIQKEAGRFASDRNNISRVWMDHGIWPYFTTRLYIDQSGDMDILFEDAAYWKDHQIRRAKARDSNWQPSDGNVQKTADGAAYGGTILEHMLVQHLTCFHNVGDHNNMKLEDADWNDLLDMANEKGESVPFSAFYGWNLITLSGLLRQWKQASGSGEIELFRELLTLTGLEGRVDYEDAQAKRYRLSRYFDAVNRLFSGIKVKVDAGALADELEAMGRWELMHVRGDEWMESESGHGFFNGYYNNDGQRVDGDFPECTRLNLTAQTFAVMTGAATDEQARRAYSAVRSILRDPHTGGYRLTMPLGGNTWNFGRGFAVVYGEKETGGTFNHMVVMCMNALYRRGFVREAYETFKSVYGLATDTPNARIYPGIPEYISHEGRGMYHYLSGSASWLLLTVLTQMFGVRGRLGDLVLSPKLASEQFDTAGRCGVDAWFLGRKVTVTYSNTNRLEYGEYRMGSVTVNGRSVEYMYSAEEGGCIIAKAGIEKAFAENNGNINQINVELIPNE